MATEESTDSSMNGHAKDHPATEHRLPIEKGTSKPSTNGHTTMGHNGPPDLEKTDGDRCDRPPFGHTSRFTDQVIAATGPNANPRLAEIMPLLISHLHAFATEVNLTTDEWLAGVALINEAGQMSDNRRNETQLLCDVLGLEALVDDITFRQVGANNAPIQDNNSRHSEALPIRPGYNRSSTSSSILGPFHRLNAPILPPDSSIVCPSLLASSSTYANALTHLSGRVLSSSGEPLPDAILDIWHAAPNGMYEQQDANQPDMHLRGRFATDSSGHYSLYCLRPPAYPIPDDGPAGRLLRLLDRHPFRPAHIHFIVSKRGYRALTTQLFDGQCKYIGNDAVFAVKLDLAARFEPMEVDEDKNPRSARWKVKFDFVLCEEDT